MNSNEEKKGRCRHGRHRARFIFPVIIAAIILVKSALVMLLWNALVPDLFHGPTLLYPQAIGLTILAKLLVGFPFGRHGHGFHHHGPWRGGRWAHLSPEEREKMREEMRKRFCFFDHDHEDKGEVK